jgi:7-cyano-7-deazaguanine synthase
MSSNAGKTVVIVSGGLDSCGVASYWKQKGSELYLLSFNYGQRASREIERAVEIGKLIGANRHKVLDISFMKDLYGASNVLTDKTLEMPSHFQSNIIVPIRNAVFLTIATAYAFSIGAPTVAYGAHLTDAPYPDCRPEFAHSLASALNLGDSDAIAAKIHEKISIWSPAIEGLTKSEMLGISYGLLGENLFRTWSCYLDGETQCGRCESCRNRRIAFEKAGIKDLTKYSDYPEKE